MMTPIMDISLVAGRRPGLLQQTLNSFSKNLFVNCSIGQVIVNIDPIFGGARDGEATKAVVRSFFPEARIYAPEQSGFCAAVKRNWAISSAPFVFHLEDDWILNEVITASIFDHFQDRTVDQVSLESREKKWDWEKRGNYHYFWRKVKIFGVRIPVKRYTPFFTTSPSFLRGDFARGAAALMNPKYDPEKQFSAHVNRRLERFVKTRRNLLVRAEEGFLITDTGRSWREERGVTKFVSNGVSRWSSSQLD